ncbi:hypothetical protein H311_01110 [Anncaliia algerae PRA109]|nr:hypothetical protein H311_01110 [Anncaliia algerae PRA109]
MRMELKKYDRRLITILITSLIIMAIAHLLPPLDYLDYDFIHNNRPHKENTISMFLLYMFYIVIPSIFLGVICKLQQNQPRYIFLVVFSFLLAHSTNTCASEILKVVVGEKRPDFIARCKPINKKCTGKIDEINEGKKSFPSGHSATVFVGSIFVLLFLYFFILDNFINYLGKLVATFFISLILLVFAVTICSTRINDNRHFLHDVIAGAGMGTFFASINFYFVKNEIEKSAYE